MTSDGISSEDWNQVHELAVELVNAPDDESEPVRQRLFECLRRLTAKYGELPSILATHADYVDDPRESERLFLRAFDIAQARGDRAYIREISLSLADLYVNTLRDAADATRWLEVANAYMSADSEMDKSEYQGIQEAIARLNGSKE